MDIRFSMRMAVVLLSLHLATSVLVFVTNMPLWIRLMLLLLIVVSLAYHLSRDVFFLLQDSWRKLSLAEDGVTIVTRDGSRLHGKIVDGTVVNPNFIALRIKSEGNFLVKSRLFFPDSLGLDEFRRMCVRLKFT